MKRALTSVEVFISLLRGGLLNGKSIGRRRDQRTGGRLKSTVVMMGKPHFYIGKLQGKVGRGEGGTSRPFFHSGQAGRQKDKRQDQIHLDQNGKAIERHREREMALIYSLLETPPGRFQPTPDWGSIRRKKVKRYLSEPYHALSITHTHTLNTHKQHGRRGIVSPPYKNCTYTHQLKKAKVVPPHLFPGKGKARTPPPPFNRTPVAVCSVRGLASDRSAWL